MESFLGAWRSIVSAWSTVLRHPENAAGNDWLLCFLTVAAVIVLGAFAAKRMEA